MKPKLSAVSFQALTLTTQTRSWEDLYLRGRNKKDSNTTGKASLAQLPSCCWQKFCGQSWIQQILLEAIPMVMKGRKVTGNSPDVLWANHTSPIWLSSVTKGLAWYMSVEQLMLDDLDMSKIFHVVSYDWMYRGKEMAATGAQGGDRLSTTLTSNSTGQRLEQPHVPLRLALLRARYWIRNL